MLNRDRGSKAGSGPVFPGEGGNRGGRNSAAGAWQPSARIAVFLMLGVLCGADIWIFTAAKISSLPQVQVHVYPSELGKGLPGMRVG